MQGGNVRIEGSKVELQTSVCGEAKPDAAQIELEPGLHGQCAIDGAGQALVACFQYVDADLVDELNEAAIAEKRPLAA